MKTQLSIILAFILTVLAGCGGNQQSNETVLEAAKWFVEAATEGNVEKMEGINHSDDWNVPADYIIDKANETGVIGMTESDYDLTQVDERVVIVSFVSATDPWVLEFNKESTGYYFSDLLMLRDYEEELDEILSN